MNILVMRYPMVECPQVKGIMDGQEKSKVS